MRKFLDYEQKCFTVTFSLTNLPVNRYSSFTFFSLLLKNKFWETNPKPLFIKKGRTFQSIISLWSLWGKQKHFLFYCRSSNFSLSLWLLPFSKKKKLEKTEHWQLALNSIFLNLFLFFSPVLFFFGSQAEEGFCGGFFFDQTTSVKFLKNSCCCCLLQMKTRILFNVY